MGKKISGLEGATFGLRSSVDVYKKLLQDAEKLRKSWDVYDATDFMITAWHLFNDWPTSDPKGSLSRLKRDRRKLPMEMNLVLDVTRDLVNGSKHFMLNQSSADKRKISEVHEGLEANYFSYFFHENTPGVTVEGGWYFSVRVLHNILLAYYQWVFNENQSKNDFPIDVLDAIVYCNIQTRETRNIPRVWGGE